MKGKNNPTIKGVFPLSSVEFFIIVSKCQPEAEVLLVAQIFQNHFSQISLLLSFKKKLITFFNSKFKISNNFIAFRGRDIFEYHMELLTTWCL